MREFEEELGFGQRMSGLESMARENVRRAD